MPFLHQGKRTREAEDKSRSLTPIPDQERRDWVRDDNADCEPDCTARTPIGRLAFPGHPEEDATRPAGCTSGIAEGRVGKGEEGFFVASLLRMTPPMWARATVVYSWFRSSGTAVNPDKDTARVRRRFALRGAESSASTPE
jgi:hypothetical protein